MKHKGELNNATALMIERILTAPIFCKSAKVKLMMWSLNLYFSSQFIGVVKFSFTGFRTVVSVPKAYQNKLPQTWWLTAINIYSLHSRDQSLKPRWWCSGFLLEALRKN